MLALFALALVLRLAVLRNSTLRGGTWNLHRIRRFGRLGRVLERNATENRLDCWRRYVTHDLVLVARAVDGLPMGCLVGGTCATAHWHIATVATLAHTIAATTITSAAFTTTTKRVDCNTNM